jgi:hypothetical protein
MSSHADWQERNDRYLAAVLDWLRLRLDRMAGLGREPAPAAREGRRQRRPPEPQPARVVPRRVTDAQVTAAAAAVAAAEQGDPPPAAVVLSRRFGLSPFEREVLLLCAAMELDTGIPLRCARAQDDPARPYPTFALALALSDAAAWEALSPERPLRYWRLIELHRHGHEPLTASAIRADERIVNFLKGLNQLDDRLGVLLEPVPMPRPDEGLPPSQHALVQAVTARIEGNPPDQPLPATQLVGPFAASARLVASHAAAALGLRLYRLPGEALSSQVQEIELLARLWRRETTLLPVALFLADGDGAEDPPGRQPQRRLLERTGGMVVVQAHDPVPGIAGVTLDVAKPTPAEQQALWAEELGPGRPGLPALLAGQFNLESDEIRRIARAVGAGGQAGEDPVREVQEQVWDACRATTRPRLEALAERLEAKATWEDLVLRSEELATLRHMAGQVAERATIYDDWGFRERMNRGLGITALFAGESGTGKTMAAEVIANHLRLDLYRIDLSAVVSKYIGETEKNLRKVFDAAEDGGAILFFDEADALFGKRSQVKDSHDRYANIETNYLLQRMEAYHGLAVLATNMKGALDAAFVRRLRFIVTFPFPELELRARIWQAAFPQRAPVDRLDIGLLAGFSLTGGSISNAALNAAFMAASARSKVTMPIVLAAVREEFRKLDRPVNETHFRWEEQPGAVA